MTFLDAFWHIANFFAPAFALGLVSALATKTVWRRELAAVPWGRLWAAASIAAAVVAIAGLIAYDADGRMATYAGMVVASALALWWVGFRRAR